jgi:hypothetical protein
MTERIRGSGSDFHFVLDDHFRQVRKAIATYEKAKKDKKPKEKQVHNMRKHEIVATRNTGNKKQLSREQSWLLDGLLRRINEGRKPSGKGTW